MIKIVIDEATKAKIGNPEQPVELYDAGGSMLGYVTPAQHPSIIR